MKYRKITALMLSCAMAASLCPVSLMAEEAATEMVTVGDEAAAEEAAETEDTEAAAEEAPAEAPAGEAAEEETEAALTEQYLEDAKLAREISEESIVLLENKDNTLPLAEGTSVAVFGTGQSAFWKSGCDGSAAINGKTETTLIEGLEGLDGELVVNQTIKNLYEENSEDFMYAPTDEEVIAASEESDVALVIISRTGGESADLVTEEEPGGNDVPWQQRYYYLHEQEEQIINLACENFEKVVVMINAGGLMDISWTQDYDIDGLLFLGLPGMEGGTAVANILTGKVNPSGSLADTWAWQLEDHPSTENIQLNIDGYVTVVTTGSVDNPGEYTVYDGAYYGEIPEDAVVLESGNQEDLWTYYNAGAPKYTEVEEYVAGQYVRAKDEHFYSMYEEGIFVGYRYFDTFDVEVAYPFGYGLSYTDFEMEVADIQCSEEEIQVSVTVTNTGDTAGKEVVQVYYAQPDGDVVKAAKELGGFGKTDLLEPGESQTLQISFDTDYMYTFYDDYSEDGGAYVLDDGDYVIYVGSDVEHVQEAGTYTLTEERVIADGLDDATEIQEEYQDTFTEYDGTEETYPNSDDLTKSYLTNMTGASYKAEDEEGYMDYAVTDRATTMNSGFSDEVREAAEEISQVEAEYSLYDVYAGNCTLDEFVDQMSAVEMAALVVGAGNTQEGDLFITTAENTGNSTRAIERLGIPSIQMSDGPHGVGAFGLEWPGETNQAMTWNTDLIYQMGQAIGEEAATEGIELWLAPNLNLHRNPINGRNAEAYSEDPVLAGVMGTMSVQGVQSTGTGVVVKHYCNYDVQSTGWYEADTIVSERTLRELYMKSYQICVEDADPWAMMSSYALLNGEFSSCAGGINLTVLRDEWDWDGILMTDWEGHGGLDISALNGGTNLLMPGFDGSVSYVYSAYLQTEEDGEVTVGHELDLGQSLTLDTLKENVKLILNCIMKTKSFYDMYGIQQPETTYDQTQNYMTAEKQ